MSGKRNVSVYRGHELANALYLAPRSFALEAFKSPILLLLQSPQLASRSDNITMQLLIEQLDINSCAGEIKEYLARFSLWQGAHEDMSEEAAKGAFLAVIGGPAFSLVSTLVFPKSLQEAALPGASFSAVQRR